MEQFKYIDYMINTIALTLKELWRSTEPIVNKLGNHGSKPESCFQFPLETF